MAAVRVVGIMRDIEFVSPDTEFTDMEYTKYAYSLSAGFMRSDDNDEKGKDSSSSSSSSDSSSCSSTSTSGGTASGGGTDVLGTVACHGGAVGGLAYIVLDALPCMCECGGWGCVRFSRFTCILWYWWAGCRGHRSLEFFWPFGFHWRVRCRQSCGAQLNQD